MLEYIWVGDFIKCILLVEGSGELDSTLDVGELRQVNAVQLLVLLDGETTVNKSEIGHRDVVQVRVVVEDQVTSLGQVHGGEVGQASAPETELAVRGLEGRNSDTRDVTEGQALSTLQVGELNVQLVVVSGEVDQTSSVGEVVEVDHLEGVVVLDVEVTDGLQGETIQAGQTSVDDADVANLGNTLAEVKGLQLGESLPVDSTDRAELAEAELREAGEASKGEVLANVGKGVGAERGDVLTTATLQATLDLLDTVQGQFAGEGVLNGDITANGGAAGEAIGIGLGLESGVTTVCTARSDLLASNSSIQLRDG